MLWAVSGKAMRSALQRAASSKTDSNRDLTRVVTLPVRMRQSRAPPRRASSLSKRSPPLRASCAAAPTRLPPLLRAPPRRGSWHQADADKACTSAFFSWCQPRAVACNFFVFAAYLAPQTASRYA